MESKKAKLNSYDIIIQAGQSNAEGSGVGSVKNEYSPTDKVHYLESVKEVIHTPERVVVNFADMPFQFSIAEERKIDGTLLGDFSLYFARKYIEEGLLNEGRKLLIIRAAVGGTGFKKGDWGVGNVLYDKMIEMTNYALALNKNNRVVAFLWHQGEHDAVEGTEAGIYHSKLSTMLKEMRSLYGAMPFIAADFVNDWKMKNLAICEPIVDKIRQVTEENEKSAFVETKDLQSNSQKTGSADDIHFCRQSLCVLGERYFEQYKKVLDN